MGLLQNIGFNRKRKEHDNLKLALLEFNKSISLFIEKEQLKASVIGKIQEITKAKRIFLFLYNDDYYRYVLTDVIGVDKKLYSKYYFSSKDKLVYWLKVNEKHLLLSKDTTGIKSFFTKHEQNMLESMGVSYIHPLKTMNRLTGLIFLGQKDDGKDYFSEEIDLLNILLDQAAIAFENVTLYENQRDRMKKLYRNDRLAIMGQLAAGAAHEIRNPLTSIRSTIQYVQKDIENPVKAKMTLELLDEVDRINEIINGLLSFSNPDKLKPEKVNLQHLINQTVLLIKNTAKKKNCEIALHYSTEKEELVADSSQLKQVFLNIVMNAIQAVQDSGRVDIIVDFNDKEEEGYNIDGEYLIRFIDNGIGISDENMEKMFDPFYTTKDDGTGLGLSISYGIIIKHGGDIKVESELGKGAEIKVKLPIACFIED